MADLGRITRCRACLGAIAWTAEEEDPWAWVDGVVPWPGLVTLDAAIGAGLGHRAGCRGDVTMEDRPAIDDREAAAS